MSDNVDPNGILRVKNYLDEFLETHEYYNLYSDADCTLLQEKSAISSSFSLLLNPEKCWNMSRSEDKDYVSFAFGGEAVGDPPGTEIKIFSVTGIES